MQTLLDLHQAIISSYTLEVCGLIGAAIYVMSYGLLSVGMVKGDSPLYILLNTVAALCVLLSLTEDFNLASAIIQVTWVGFSVIGIIRSPAFRGDAELS